MTLHLHLPTPHRTRKGVQWPNLTVSTKHIIKLITLTFFSLRPHRTRTPASNDSRRQPTRARMRHHSPLTPSHSLTSPTQTLRNTIDDDALLPPVPTRTRAGAERPHFSMNDRNDIERDSSPPPVHTPDGLPPPNATPDARRSTASKPHREH